MTPAERVTERRAEIAEQETRVARIEHECGPHSLIAEFHRTVLTVFRENLALALEDLAAEQCSVRGCNLDSVPSDVEGYCIVHRHMLAHARREVA